MKSISSAYPQIFRNMLFVCLICVAGWTALSALTEPYPAPAGMRWELGNEMIADGGFENGTVGTTPSGWSQLGGTVQVTEGSARTGTKALLMEPTNARTQYVNIPTAVGKYYYYEIHWRHSYEGWGGNIRISPVKDPGTAGTWPRGFVEIGRDETSPSATQVMINGRQPAFDDYAYLIGWNRFGVTFEIIGSISDFGNMINPYLWAYAPNGSPWYIDDITLRELYLIPEPASALLLAFAGLTLLKRRR